MSEPSNPSDPRDLWKSQPAEKQQMQLEYLRNRRTRELRFATRSTALGSLAAAVFYLVVMGWRLESYHGVWKTLGFSILALWILAHAYRFRRVIMQSSGARAASAAGSCSEHYLQELKARRDHLRWEWLWHTALLAGCLLPLIGVAAETLSNWKDLSKVLPFTTLLLFWLVAAVRLHFVQARQLQEEIDQALSD